ncbi:Asp-tRNA(Asn)/Glu-tRNA(Gln) amidotransferase subunit GatA [Propionibacterium freudenreichii]|uniref:Asp-tRNA(Asn)/Glu-tRNA(Gln) amidotransferase subunit GatA n=1 Tax=Propionibacterium freudenreichii TaxID=1744 RepID=UPI00254C41D6|nr:Asp-tRNA(Asn)/Glu-tRNA(Gln) amidotransferase subunit GatA [Propionibacterium freudenreichii]MDK9652518.1 Asp-tRNA(Asn)/Glu-tRNA(Gln) amidotransferase subunit GatA [Propionibacterium freudenreichii]
MSSEATVTNDILTTPALELGRRIAAREQSSTEVTGAFLDQIDAVEPAVHAFLAVDRDLALRRAGEVDAQIAAGERLSPLAGVPVAVKDLLCYQGLPTTAASRILEGWMSPYDATVVRRLQAGGLVILGKTNLDEFASGSSTESSGYGPTHNPWDLERIPGGSGGGSAAALAACEAPLAIGTDTGGSIRQPAAMTGTVGVKPTYGGVSRFGIIAMASSLDQCGPCARNAADAAALHQVIAGYDPQDSTSLDRPVPPVRQAAERADVTGMRIGVVRELGGEGYAPGVEARFGEAVAQLEAAGAEVIEVSCPRFEQALTTYYLIMPSELSSNLARYDAMRYGLRVGDDGHHSVEQVMRLSRGQGFGAEVKRRIILGTYALSAGYYDAYYGSAQKMRTLIARDFAAAFDRVDALVSPVAPTTAFKLGEKVDDPLAMYMGDLCTIPSNLAGIAAGSFPCGASPDDGLPVGFQVMAPALGDDQVYRVGAALERLVGPGYDAALSDRAAALPGSLVSMGKDAK